MKLHDKIRRKASMSKTINIKMKKNLIYIYDQQTFKYELRKNKSRANVRIKTHPQSISILCKYQQKVSAKAIYSRKPYHHSPCSQDPHKNPEAQRELQAILLTRKNETHLL